MRQQQTIQIKIIAIAFALCIFLLQPIFSLVLISIFDQFESFLYFLTAPGRVVTILIILCGMVAYIGVIRAIVEDLKHAQSNTRFFFIILGSLNAIHFFFCCYEENLSFGDSLWFAATLATGAGFGDVTLTQPEGRIRSAQNQNFETNQAENKKKRERKTR